LMENNIICAHRMGGIRFSPHFYTSQEKIDKALEILTITN
jgi:cysteine desulfurase / selenocysteine lyase